MSDYLWNRTGAPDPEIEELERRLKPLRFAGRFESGAFGGRRRERVPYGAIAAALLIGVAAWRLLGVVPGAASAWAVTGVQGEVRAGGGAVSVAEKLRTGQPLTTGAGGQVSLLNDEFGEVNLGSESFLRLTQSRGGRDVMSLERGRLHAFIWAPPRRFVVDTPSSRAIDLGCEYTLTVDPEGNGLVDVELGWVAFQFGSQESFIPAGASCRTTRRGGPGIPYFRDAGPEFFEALERFENGDRTALRKVLQTARTQDGLTLWHLISRVVAEDRAAVFDRFAELVELPEEVRREKVLARDAETLDRCWNALGLDDAGWWREWKHEWKVR